ncbi:hybrid sensor histidine kinase/response regulator [Calditrichota bacterium LG25]
MKPPLESDLSRKILENAGDALICFDEQGEIVFWNAAATEMFGYRKTEAVGQKMLFLLFEEEQRRLFERMIDEVEKNEGPHLAPTFELQAVGMHGEQIPAEVTLSSFTHKNARYFTALMRDVRSRKKRIELESRTQQLQALSRLAGKIASDFNNVLSVVRGYVELMRIQIDERNPFAKQIEAILKSIEHAEKLDEQLMTFAQEPGQTTQNVDLARVYGSLKDLLLKLLEPDISLKEEIETDLWTVRGEPQTFKQIFLNLFMNAREAMPEGGEIQLKIQNIRLNEAEKDERGISVGSDRFLLIQIADTGRGMPEEVQKKIFEPFFTTDEREEKRGLGLSVVYGLVQSMNGVILCDSQVGRGTIFSIYLPAGREAEEKVTEESAIPASGGEETILVVEDVPEVQLLLLELLQTVGYKTIGVSSYQDAMDYYRAHGEEIDLIISDVVLPDQYGTELIRKLMEERPNLKYILISGYADQLDIEGNKTLFQGHFLQKPFHPSTLLQMVREMLDEDGAD